MKKWVMLSVCAWAVHAQAQNVESPFRISVAHELSYKAEEPDRLIKNRSSVRVEYAKYLMDRFFLQFDGKATVFLGKDHRHEAEESDTRVSQAYIQTSINKTSIRAGIQTLPWGESILAPITDEVSPRDNRELFNFNLDELRIGQPMVTVDQFLDSSRWSVFYIPSPSLNKNPERGTAYFFDPLHYRNGKEGDGGAEYGASWRKNFGSADITLMAASLIDNNLSLRMNADGLVTREKRRLSLAGAVFNYAIKDFIIRGEAALKTPRAYNNAAMQIVKKSDVDTYFGIEYRHSPTLTLSVEAVNQHVRGWDDQVQGVPRDRQSLLFSLTKLLMHDDLSINLLHFHNQPYRSNLTILESSLKWDDHLTFGLNAIFPYTRDEKSGLWNVRDQKQIAFKVQYQF